MNKSATLEACKHKTSRHSPDGFNIIMGATGDETLLPH